MKKENLEDRMKRYENAESARRVLPLLPVCIRLDGRRFSRWTYGLAKPYDPRLSRCMLATTKFLVEETGARIGYTQSDEITLVLYSDDASKEVFFGGRLQKLVSGIASMATAFFNQQVQEQIPERRNRLAYFDCRAWNVPTLTEAANVVLWRELDAIRNSLQIAAQTHYSSSALMHKTQQDMRQMLLEKGVNWSDYAEYFKRGAYYQRRSVMRRLSQDEWEKIPEAHRPAREQKVQRMTTLLLTGIPLLQKIHNREEFLFQGKEWRKSPQEESADQAILDYVMESLEDSNEPNRDVQKIQRLIVGEVQVSSKQAEPESAIPEQKWPTVELRNGLGETCTWDLAPHDGYIPQSYIIGSGPAAFIRVDDHMVSRSHARIEYKKGRFYLTDLGWADRGTVINGSIKWKKDGTFELKHGDIIRVGKTRICFHWPSQVCTSEHITD